MVEADNTLYDDDLKAYIAGLQENAEAFLATIGKEELEIYRIEKFNPVKQEKSTHGKFYDGDSYVIVKEGEKNYDIHYWHGKDATSDEMGSSAAFTVQISGVLSKASRHHLEEMSYETDLFMSYFKGGLFYLPGGIESGWKKPEERVHEPKLLLVKGKRYPRVFEVPLEANSLNEGDSFILDLDTKLFIWNGAECSNHERNKARDMAEGIRLDERMMNATVHFPQTEEAIAGEFWDALGGKPSKINPAVPDEQPQGSEEDFMMCKLFHLSDATGSVQLNEITERPLKRSHLDDNDTYILELFNQVYVWQGNGASKQEKQMGMKYAKDFVKNNNKPKGTKISRLPQGVEDTNFKSFFEDFYPAIKQDFGEGANRETHADQDISKVAAQQVKAKQLITDKLGANWTKKVYALDDGKTPTEITDPAEQGKFFAETNYVVIVEGASHKYIVKWFGTKQVIETLAGVSEAVNTLLGGAYSSNETIFTVKKGQEDETFLGFFPEGFAILDEARIPMGEWQDKTNANGVMFRVQAPYGGAARSIEQNSRSSQYLNSGDAFVVMMPGLQSAFVWHGPGANDEERKGAQQVFDLFSRPDAIETCDEGQESEAFWESLGGKGEYSHVKDCSMIPPADFEPRLFSVSNASGYIWMKEVPQFQQEDLINEDCMVLDAFSTIYVWIGALSNKFEKKGALVRAQKYLEGLHDSRDKDQVVIEEIEAGHEPPMFRVQFVQWEPEIAEAWLAEDPKEIARRASEAKAAVTKALEDNPFGQYVNGNTQKFAYEELNGKFPQGVKPDSKELYLSDEDFNKIFGMTLAEFQAMTKPKQVRKKKEVGLY